MGSFKQKGSTERIEQRYFERVHVILESEEDYQIVGDRWFFDVGDDITFAHADEGEGGGANKVCSKVNALRAGRVSSYGIVDRDAIRTSHPELWWETDDTIFMAKQPFESVRVLSRWEIENYLLDPEIIEETLADMEARSVRRGSQALLAVYGHLDAAIKLSAADIVSGQHGKRFDAKLDKCDAEHLYTQIAKKIPDLVDELPDAEARIRAFGTNYPAPSVGHWDGVCRLIDGKRLLRRLRLMHGKLGGNDRRLELANKLRNRNRVPTEIREYVDSFREVARTAAPVGR
ncbi:MAG: hypothetical protein KJ558_16365 [Gammaproteobacteria bacterium]|nr:hypothetical protein [Gammaproteobacteria bacterium]MBU1656365.1 hypothetical protein [Gammaproteobacteria bacterium]MBU1959711.1 hypothetical protein [Gammaproteobacteria bacterium]